MAHAFTRVTLVGSRKHVDLLLPSDQPVGLLLPQVLNLLDDPPAEAVAAKVLVAPDGTELNAETSLSQARVLDGSSLLLCNASEAPPSAVVYDVTDLVVSESGAVAGRWNRRCKDLTAGLFAAAGLWAGSEILLTSLAPDAAWWMLLALSLLGLAAGAAAGRPPRRTALGPALLGAGWLSGLGGVFHLYDGVPERLPTAALVLAGLSVLALAAVGTGAAQRRAWFSGAATLALAAGLWTAAGAVTGDAVGTAALATLASILLLGLLPKLALGSSGLATLDDQRAKGGSITRTDAVAAVAAAHRSLTLGTAITALSIAPGLWLLGTDPNRQHWTLPLLLALTLAVFLRTRSFPLAPQRTALYLAVAVGLCAGALAALRFVPDQPWAVGLGVLGTAAAAAVSLTATFPDHTQARFRLLAKRAETGAILVSVPLAAGLFGVFGQLLGSF
ncbi:type VII secretion integral membrane protein EccD [Arthrobacter sp. zg-Y820]|uniref:type VII secretion integral membrane protein EccD n=1 Tax=unclassified Arthrobacter TaxID=235627 RepID=UPI001E37C07F|nr:MULTISPECIES: type VII secretion integral membrane protein EccD [unclassified Arthrobacter]MCC9198066.1 type VII secretion integral membrane protein EccD [Arthrobacter sp. zg-Y820]MDK1280933.1 type VII secretion integral membrane protein EccD [Arthrobacter sp. zg.Y820]WIB10408.1 type VII secretion integral membrane protein EccD [Arthrobacter sp. zg-Y820]